MILDHKGISLFDKMLFEKAVVKPPFKGPNPMPNEACFIHVRKGRSRAISEVEKIDIYAGEFVLIKCGNYITRMFSDEEEGNYEAVAIHFYPEVLKKIYGSSLPSFLKKYNYTFHSNMVKVRATELVQKYIESIIFYFENPQLVTEDILILKVKEIILLLLQTENAPGVIEILTNLFSEKTFDFKEIIEAHICSDLSMLELAQLTNHSLSSFKRTFKKIYEDTPANYIKSQRLEKSMELLSVTEDSVSHIAYDCGFKDIAHFSKSFKNKYGMTPSEYRYSLKVKKVRSA